MNKLVCIVSNTHFSAQNAVYIQRSNFLYPLISIYYDGKQQLHRKISLPKLILNIELDLDNLFFVHLGYIHLNLLSLPLTQTNTDVTASTNKIDDVVVV